jgi:hypothetical protein
LFVGFLLVVREDVSDAFPESDAIYLAPVGFLLNPVEPLIEPPEGKAKHRDNGSLLRQLLEDALLHAALRFALTAYNLDAPDDGSACHDDSLGEVGVEFQPECCGNDGQAPPGGCLFEA